jgi:hypothetical protein
MSAFTLVVSSALRAYLDVFVSCLVSPDAFVTRDVDKLNGGDLAGLGVAVVWYQRETTSNILQ